MGHSAISSIALQSLLLRLLTCIISYSSDLSDKTDGFIAEVKNMRSLISTLAQVSLQTYFPSIPSACHGLLCSHATIIFKDTLNSFAHADLTPLFNWNTKQLFLYLEAEYENAQGVSLTLQSRSCVQLSPITPPLLTASIPPAASSSSSSSTI